MVKRPFRALFSALALIPATIVGAIAQSVLLKLDRPESHALPMMFHRFALSIIDVRVKVIGEPSTQRPLLMASNHSSWLDIPVLGSTCRMAFVAKAEIENWPVFGLLAKLQRTIFVDRSRRTATATVNRQMADHMLAGEPVVLFAEGTSSDGNRVLPFRTALLGAAQAAILRTGGGSVAVQPVSIAYTHRNGLPLGRLNRPFVAWYGDMTFITHLWSILTNGAIDVTVTFGEPMAFDASTDRKAIAATIEREVRRLTTNALLGRPLLPDEVEAPEIAEAEAPVAAGAA